MGLLKKGSDGKVGVDFYSYCADFDKAVQSGNIEGAKGQLIDAARAFVDASKQNGEKIDLQTGLNRTLGWMGYHEASSQRHTENGRKAIEAAELAVSGMS